MPCHETVQIGGSFEEPHRPAALETVQFGLFHGTFRGRSSPHALETVQKKLAILLGPFRGFRV